MRDASGIAAARAARDVVPARTGYRASRDTDFGLVVGVDHYPRFRSLQGAVNDAINFHAWLIDPDGGGVAPQHAHLVRSTHHPIAPLQDEVDERLLEIVTAADAIQGGRRLYFHFSGHGAGSPGESGEDVALLLAKWSRRLAGLALSTDEYRGVLSGMGLFEEIVISLDCCRAAAEPAFGMPPTLTVRPETAPCDTRTFVAYATAPGRSAFEVPDQELWQGVFTRCLLAILRRSPHGLSATELKRVLECEVALRGQQPHVKNGLLDGSRFGHRGVLPRLVIALDVARGRVRLRNGSRAIVAECDAGTEPREPPVPPWELPIEAGLYKLEDATGKTKTFEHGAEAVTRVEF